MALHISSTVIIPNCFCVGSQYCPCHRERYFSFWHVSQFQKYLGFREFAQYERKSKFAASDLQLRGYQLQEGLAFSPILIRGRALLL